ncbi:hypothetical protein [Vibrio ostreicida]|uniref:hypothetical protein n=1 Tax=Vibrio ostreicida TaxID=526588 RepID=UPI000971088F|nr:hypothetical protein [Vibrio ostreicida]
MKRVIILNMLLSVFISQFSYALTAPPSGALGVLTVDNMRQGQLFRLNGRVGEANYTFTHQDKKTCSVKVPVAVGSLSEANLGITKTKGLTIVVLSQRLNKALIQGKRVMSIDWHFARQAEADNVDGLIVSGISPNEGFVLNSRRRWISWFLGKSQSAVCR